MAQETGLLPKLSQKAAKYFTGQHIDMFGPVRIFRQIDTRLTAYPPFPQIDIIGAMVIV